MERAHTKGMDKSMKKGGCRKCLGTGHIAFYAHNNGGRCNRCNGSGKAPVKYVSTAAELAEEAAWRANKVVDDARMAARFAAIREAREARMAAKVE